MKHLTLLLFAVLTLTSCGSTVQKEETTDEVFICTGPQARKYHATPDCMGLKRCSQEVAAVSKEEAESEGKTPCKMCY